MLILPRFIRRSFKDTSRFRFGEGSVQLTFLSPDGLVLDVWDLGKNIIVQQGSANMSHLLAGDDVGNRIVSTVALGSAGHNPSAPTQALPVSVSDTALNSSVVISKPTTVSYPNGTEGGQIQFSATIGAGEANGSGAQAISEAGLFDIVPRMMTHKTFGLITKTSDFGISIAWTILYAIFFVMVCGNWLDGII